MKRTRWESEAALCEAFAAQARRHGWTVHAEVAGHDLMLIAPQGVPAHFEPGDQVAVEVKLQASVGLLRQLLPPDLIGQTASADFHVAVVPSSGTVSDLRQVGRRLDIAVESASPDGPDIPFGGVFGEWGSARYWPRAARVGSRLWCPDVVVDTAAGVPSPRSTTRWKIAAVRFCLLHRNRTVVEDSRSVLAPVGLTAMDFRSAGLDVRTFLRRGWAEAVSTSGRSICYRLIDAPDRPDHAYPEIVEALSSGGAA